MDAFRDLDRADTISFATIAICACAALASAPSQDKVALAITTSLCFGVWIAGVVDIASSVNVASPERGALFDAFLTHTVALVPLYVALVAYKDARMNTSVLVGALFTSLGVGIYALSEEAQTTRDALITASRPLSVAVIAAALIVAAQQTAAAVGAAAVVEVAYVTIASYKPDRSVLQTFETVTGITLPNSVPAPPPGACEPLCVEPGGGDAESRCYAHNENVARVHERARANGKQGLPETLGLSTWERKCLRSHTEGSTCAYCQEGGCVARSRPNTVCTRSRAEVTAQLAKVKAASERAVVSGAGVLTLEQQFN